MTEWQPIETAPKDGTFVLGYGEDIDGDYRISIMKYESFKNGSCLWIKKHDYHPYGLCDIWINTAPTHWMPLPAPPT